MRHRKTIFRADLILPLAQKCELKYSWIAVFSASIPLCRCLPSASQLETITNLVWGLALMATLVQFYCVLNTISMFIILSGLCPSVAHSDYLTFLTQLSLIKKNIFMDLDCKVGHTNFLKQLQRRCNQLLAPKNYLQKPNLHATVEFTNGKLVCKVALQSG